jgi:hypothetical protein
MATERERDDRPVDHLRRSLLIASVATSLAFALVGLRRLGALPPVAFVVLAGICAVLIGMFAAALATGVRSRDLRPLLYRPVSFIKEMARVRHALARSRNDRPVLGLHRVTDTSSHRLSHARVRHEWAYLALRPSFPRLMKAILYSLLRVAVVVGIFVGIGSAVAVLFVPDHIHIPLISSLVKDHEIVAVVSGLIFAALALAVEGLRAGLAKKRKKRPKGSNE